MWSFFQKIQMIFFNQLKKFNSHGNIQNCTTIVCKTQHEMNIYSHHVAIYFNFHLISFEFFIENATTPSHATKQTVVVFLGQSNCNFSTQQTQTPAHTLHFSPTHADTQQKRFNYTFGTSKYEIKNTTVLLSLINIYFHTYRL